MCSCAYTCTEYDGIHCKVLLKLCGSDQHVAITTSITTSIVSLIMFVCGYWSERLQGRELACSVRPTRLARKLWRWLCLLARRCHHRIVHRTWRREGGAAERAGEISGKALSPTRCWTERLKSCATFALRALCRDRVAVESVKKVIVWARTNVGACKL